MTYTWIYKTPNNFSDLQLYSDGEVLTGLCFVGSKDSNKHTLACEEKELLIFKEAIAWLDMYFSGKNPDFTPKYKIEQLTPFRKEVFDIMLSIPYGETITYGHIANQIAQKRGIEKMSAQAVGGAVGWNPICIIIPCHRVMGINNTYVGYGGGIQNKIALLQLENQNQEIF